MSVAEGTNNPDISRYVALSLLTTVFLPVLIFTLELFVRTTWLTWELPAAAGLSSPLLCFPLLRRQPRRMQFAAFMLPLCTVAVSLWLSGLYYDTTWDSRAYHADGILLLLQGVNPLYEMMHGFDDLWTNSYPKATWIFAAVLTHLTGNYNLGKSYNPLLALAALAYVFSWIRQRGFSSTNAFLAALAASFGPVAVNQMLCFYVDGALASLMVIAVFSALAMLTKPDVADKTALVMASCMLIDIKFTGLAYVGVIYAVCGVILLARREGLRDFIGCAALSLLVGIGVLGFNPYITNTLIHGQPLYPLVGKGSIDVVAAQSPRSFNMHHYSTAEKILRSAFSRSENVYDDGGGTMEPRMKWPFTIQEGELEAFFAGDIRIGGWGVLFGGILLLALPLCLRLLSGTAPLRLEVLTGIICLVLCMLINPGAWWARYAPQLALLPALMALPALHPREGRCWRAYGCLVFALLLLNSAFVIPASLQYARETSRQLSHQIAAIIKACGMGTYEISDVEGYHNEQFLAQNGISIVYPPEDIRKTRPASDLLPLRDVFLYKEGCHAH